jgi:hypothetical protein
VSLLISATAQRFYDRLQLILASRKTGRPSQGGPPESVGALLD